MSDRKSFVIKGHIEYIGTLAAAGYYEHLAVHSGKPHTIHGWDESEYQSVYYRYNAMQ